MLFVFGFVAGALVGLCVPHFMDWLLDKYPFLH